MPLLIMVMPFAARTNRGTDPLQHADQLIQRTGDLLLLFWRLPML